MGIWRQSLGGVQFYSKVSLYPFISSWLIRPVASRELLWLIPVIILASGLNAIMANIIGIIGIIGMIGFWTVQAEWIEQFWWMIVIFAAGFMAPTSFYPESIQSILSYTPFPQLLQIPVETLLGIIGPAAIIRSLVVGVLWLIALWCLSRVIWYFGIRKADTVGM